MRSTTRRRFLRVERTEGGITYGVPVPLDPALSAFGARGHLNSVIIAVDGGCRNNGYPEASAAITAYVSPFNNKYNSSYLLEGLAQTNQRAELDSALLALEITTCLTHSQQTSEHLSTSLPFTFPMLLGKRRLRSFTLISSS